MNTSKQEILDLFDSDEIKSILSELIEAGETISREKPTIGFHHKFYVPGWIGFFQQWAVESKMGKFQRQSFYKDKNYLDFANWMVSSSEKLAELQLEDQEKEGNNDKEKQKLQSETIFSVLHVVTDAWFNRAPEVASYPNIEYTKDTLISLAGFVFNAFEKNLRPIGYPQQYEKKKSKYESPSWSEMGNHFLGIICNIILFGLIIGLLSLIFG